MSNSNIEVTRKKKLSNVGLAENTSPNDISNALLDILHKNMEHNKRILAQILEKFNELCNMQEKNNEVLVHKIDTLKYRIDTLEHKIGELSEGQEENHRMAMHKIEGSSEKQEENHKMAMHRTDKMYEILHVEADRDDDFILMDDKKLKYKYAIDFLNDILVSIGRKAIHNIRDFKDVSRFDLLSDNCKKILDKHIDKLTEIFGKTNILYSKKDDVDHYILTVMRKIILICGFKLISHQKKMSDGNGKYIASYSYSVQ